MSTLYDKANDPRRQICLSHTIRREPCPVDKQLEGQTYAAAVNSKRSHQRGRRTPLNGATGGGVDDMGVENSCYLSGEPIDILIAVIIRNQHEQKTTETNVQQTGRVSTARVQLSSADLVDVDVEDGIRTVNRWLLAAGCDGTGGLLGGDDRYGAYYQNSTFGTHPYCWCEQPTCAWCTWCACPEEAYWYRIDDKYVDGDTFFETGSFGGEGERSNGKYPEHECDCCKRGWDVPNFWHHPTRSAVLWYKYLGRDLDEELHAPWPEILADTLNSIIAADPATFTERREINSITFPAPEFGVAHTKNR